MTEAPYFANHDRRGKFPWSLYHMELARRVARAIADHGDAAHVLVVGCGLEPVLPGAPPGTVFYGCDLDARAVAECSKRFPEMAPRLAACPSPTTLPSDGAFARSFDVVVAKEVVEHLSDPAPWARALAARVAVGGELVLTTPNYSKLSTLALLESTVLEWVARRDGYSRKHIHPSKFTKRTLAALDVGPGMRLASVAVAKTGWTLVGRWTRVADAA